MAKLLISDELWEEIVTAANVHDIKGRKSLVKQIPGIRHYRTRRKKRPNTLLGDRGYKRWLEMHPGEFRKTVSSEKS